MGNFYEDDEPVADVVEAFEGGGKGFTRPETLGYWDGDRFHFFVPHTWPDGRIARVIDFTDAVFEDGITKEEALEALVNPVYSEPITDQDQA